MADRDGHWHAGENRRPDCFLGGVSGCQRVFLLAVFLVTQWPFKALLGEEELPIGQDHTLNSWGLSSVPRGGISASAVVRGEVGVSEGLLFSFFHFSSHFIFLATRVACRTFLTRDRTCASLQWKHGVLTAGLQWKSMFQYFNIHSSPMC